MGGFLLGSSYYPEWWDESEWESDFAKMQELGLRSHGRICVELV